MKGIWPTRTRAGIDAPCAICGQPIDLGDGAPSYMRHKWCDWELEEKDPDFHPHVAEEIAEETELRRVEAIFARRFNLPRRRG